MRLQKAIEILTREINNITISPDPDVPAALKLGIEGLEYIKNLRELYKGHPQGILPSETQE